MMPGDNKFVNNEPDSTGSSKEKQRPQVSRSKNLIWAALIDLLNEKNFEDITINEIVAKGQLSRSAYYNHFTSKEDILCSYLIEIANNYLKIPPADYPNYLISDEFYKSLIIMFHENATFFCLIKKRNIWYVIEKEMFSIFFSRVGNLDHYVNVYQFKPVYIQYYVRCLMSAIIGLLFHWIKNPERETPEEFFEIFKIIRRTST